MDAFHHYPHPRMWWHEFIYYASRAEQRSAVRTLEIMDGTKWGAQHVMASAQMMNDLTRQRDRLERIAHPDRQMI